MVHTNNADAEGRPNHLFQRQLPEKQQGIRTNSISRITARLEQVNTNLSTSPTLRGYRTRHMMFENLAGERTVGDLKGQEIQEGNKAKKRKDTESQPYRP